MEIERKEKDIERREIYKCEIEITEREREKRERR